MISKIAARKLRETFLDENVTIFLREMNIVSMNEEQQEVKISPLVEGYILDIDQEFIYTGLPDGSILRVIPHQTVGLIELSYVSNVIADMEMPEPGEDVH